MGSGAGEQERHEVEEELDGSAKTQRRLSAVADLQGMPYMPRHTLRSSHAWHAYCTSRAWNGPSLARVDSPACLMVTYDSIEETHRMQGQPTNEYSLLEGLVECIL